MLALLKGRRVSLDEAWRVLSPKRSLSRVALEPIHNDMHEY
jgi:hypothetical protein